MINELMGWDFDFAFMPYGKFCSTFTDHDDFTHLAQVITGLPILLL
jgi:hypothetical protein